MYITNGIINNCDLEFEDICGTSGKNFVLSLDITSSNGSSFKLPFNPVIIPHFLKVFELEKFSEITGTYIQIDSEEELRLGRSIEDINAIRPILSNNNDDWISFDGLIYYGEKIRNDYSRDYDYFIKLAEKYSHGVCSQCSDEDCYECSTCLIDVYTEELKKRKEKHEKE